MADDVFEERRIPLAFREEPAFEDGAQGILHQLPLQWRQFLALDGPFPVHMRCGLLNIATRESKRQWLPCLRRKKSGLERPPPSEVRSGWETCSSGEVAYGQ